MIEQLLALMVIVSALIVSIGLYKCMNVNTKVKKQKQIKHKCYKLPDCFYKKLKYN